MIKILSVLELLFVICAPSAFAFDAPAEYAKAKVENRLQTRDTHVSAEFTECKNVDLFNMGDVCIIHAWITIPQGHCGEFTSDNDQHEGWIVIPRATWPFHGASGEKSRIYFSMIPLPASTLGARVYFAHPKYMGDMCTTPLE